MGRSQKTLLRDPSPAKQANMRPIVILALALILALGHAMPNSGSGESGDYGDYSGDYSGFGTGSGGYGDYSGDWSGYGTGSGGYGDYSGDWSGYGTGSGGYGDYSG